MLPGSFFLCVINQNSYGCSGTVLCSDFLASSALNQLLAKGFGLYKFAENENPQSKSMFVSMYRTAI